MPTQGVFGSLHNLLGMFSCQEPAMSCCGRHPEGVHNPRCVVGRLHLRDVLAQVVKQRWNAKSVRARGLRDHNPQRRRAHNLFGLYERSPLVQCRVKPCEELLDVFLRVQLQDYSCFGVRGAHPNKNWQQVMQNMTILKFLEDESPEEDSLPFHRLCTILQKVFGRRW